MANLSSAAHGDLREALKSFTDELTPHERAEFELCSRKDVSATIQHGVQHHGSLDYRRLQPLLGTMEQYEGLTRTHLDMSEVGTFIWGPMKYILQSTNEYTNATPALLDAYQMFYRSLPSPKLFEALGQLGERVRWILEETFHSVIKFHRLIFRQFRNRNWKPFFDALWRTALSRVKLEIENLDRCKGLLQEEISILQISEIQRSRSDVNKRSSVLESRSLETTTYLHRPLQSTRAVRLLRILPRHSSIGELDCELVELDDLHIAMSGDIRVYEALSWCWGKEPRHEEILIHSDQLFFSFNVSPNLMSALRALRLENEPRMVWVDAICINQEDDEEKSKQVARMDEIYASASTVRIWLGDEDENSDIAIDFIKNELSGLWNLDKVFENSLFSRKWTALTLLMQRPWFTRKWVIQEIALAKSAIVQCGNDTVKWRDFADAIHLLTTREVDNQKMHLDGLPNSSTFSLPVSIRPISALGATRLVRMLDSLFHRDELGHVERLSGLEHLVSVSHMFQATDPRDAIYALLSLAKDTRGTEHDAEGGPIHVSYPVDYGSAFHEVCKEFVLFCIENSEPSRELDIICRPWAPSRSRRGKFPTLGGNPQHTSVTLSAGARVLDQAFSRKSNEIVPSWVCELNNATYDVYDYPPTGPRLSRKNADTLIGRAGMPNRYRASGNTSLSLKKLRFEATSQYHSMYVEGFIVAQVSLAVEPSRLGNIPASWFELAGWNDPSGFPPEQFWRTLVADQGENLERCPPVYARVAKNCFQWDVEKGIPGGAFDIAKMIANASSPIASTFLSKVQSVIWNRSLMVLDTGALGLTHENTRDGDVVCVLHGCSVPVILRRFCKATNYPRAGESGDKHLIQSRACAARVIQRSWRRRMKRTLGTPLQRTGDSRDRHRVRVRQERMMVSGHYYELIGACYVHGIMYGEAVHLKDESGKLSETFEIR